MPTCGICQKEFLYTTNVPNGQICPRCKTTRRILRYKQRIVNRLGGKCQKCGYAKLIGLTFLHKAGTDKKFDIMQGFRTKSYKSLCLEAAKCYLLCYNCREEVLDLQKPPYEQSTYILARKSPRETENLVDF